jgi:excisionase family DNA binding protein
MNKSRNSNDYSGSACEQRTDKLLVSIAEASTLISHSRSFVYGLIRSGKIETKVTGKRRLVVLASLKAYVADLPS